MVSIGYGCQPWQCRADVHAVHGEKVKRLLSLKNEMKFRTYWYGACSADKILKFAPMEMDGFVFGTTLLFGKGNLIRKS